MRSLGEGSSGAVNVWPDVCLMVSAYGPFPDPAVVISGRARNKKFYFDFSKSLILWSFADELEIL